MIPKCSDTLQPGKETCCLQILLLTSGGVMILSKCFCTHTHKDRILPILLHSLKQNSNNMLPSMGLLRSMFTLLQYSSKITALHSSWLWLYCTTSVGQRRKGLKFKINHLKIQTGYVKHAKSCMKLSHHKENENFLPSSANCV